MSDKKQGIESNRALLASLKADMMNRTLYALTLLTAVSVPITFLTGLWGMNFTDMTELDPDCELRRHRVALHWFARSVVFCCIQRSLVRGDAVAVMRTGIDPHALTRRRCDVAHVIECTHAPRRPSDIQAFSLPPLLPGIAVSEAQGLPMGGYRIFWTTLMSTVVGIVLGMWRGGLFKALQ